MKEKTKLITTCLLGLAVCAFCIAIDQWTKYLAIVNLKGTDGHSIIEGVFKLEYLENQGAAFGILQNQKAVFIISALVILILFSYYFTKMPFTRHYMPLRICGILIISGAVGNLIDRLRLEYVVDFLYFELIDFAIFNIADSYVVVAAVLLVVLILFYYKDEDLTFLSLRKRP